MATYLDLAGNLNRSHLQRTTSEYQTTLRQLSAGRKDELAANRDISGIQTARRADKSSDLLETALRNIDIAVNVLETADRGLSTIEELVGRARGLALQSSASNLGDVERAILDVEYQSILQEVQRLSNDTTVLGQRVLVTGIRPVVIQDSFDDFGLTRGVFSLTAAETTGGVARNRNPDAAAEWIEGGELVLTRGTATSPSVGGIVARTAFPTFSGFEANFRYFGGVGVGGEGPFGPGNGVTFFLVDGSTYVNDRVPDAPDGGLGIPGSGGAYAQIPSGFIGLALDAAGLFSRQRNDISARFPDGFRGFGEGGTPAFLGDPVADTGNRSEFWDSVTLRAGETEEYRRLERVGVPAATGFSLRDDGYFDVRISLDANAILTVELSNDGGQNYRTVIDGFDLRAAGLALPGTVQFGIAATNNDPTDRYALDSVSAIAGTDVAERIRQSATNEASGIVGEVNAASGGVIVRHGTDGHDRLGLGLFDATLEGLTLANSRIRTQGAARAALQRLGFALDQLSTARVIIGAEAERFKLAREDATIALEQNVALSSLLVDTNVPDGARRASLQSVLIQIGIFTASQIEDLKEQESERLLNILA